VRGVALHVAPHFLVPLNFGISVTKKQNICCVVKKTKN
jgi:hypothetical protein